MFASTGNKGFHMTFPNGWTMSVQWGPFNYCENRDLDRVGMAEVFQPEEKSPDAEIAMWDANGEWYNFGSDTVLGHQSPERVLMWMVRCASFFPLNACDQADGAVSPINN